MNQRLLLIEDEIKLRDQLLEILDRHGYVVDACSDGLQGLNVAKKNHYDIAVIDLGLPKVSGIEIIEKIREDGREYPILILTARGDWKDKVDGLSTGADDSRMVQQSRKRFILPHTLWK